MNETFEHSMSVGHPRTYEVTCSCDIPVAENILCKIKFVEVINTGSPISLLKRELIPDSFVVIKPLSKNCFFSGINGTKLELIGLYETDIVVNDSKFFMCF